MNAHLGPSQTNKTNRIDRETTFHFMQMRNKFTLGKFLAKVHFRIAQDFSKVYNSPSTTGSRDRVSHRARSYLRKRKSSQKIGYREDRQKVTLQGTASSGRTLRTRRVANRSHKFPRIYHLHQVPFDQEAVFMDCMRCPSAIDAWPGKKNVYHPHRVVFLVIMR